jgi:hypothetical protein
MPCRAQEIPSSSSSPQDLELPHAKAGTCRLGEWHDASLEKAAQIAVRGRPDAKGST